MGQGFPVATNTKDKALVFSICIRGERYVGTVEAWRKLATSTVNDVKKLPAFTSVHIGPVELLRDGSQKLILLQVFMWATRRSARLADHDALLA